MKTEKMSSFAKNQLDRPSIVSVRWLKSSDDVPEDLWTACFPPPLEGHWWYRALERAGLEDQFEFAYGLIETGSRAIGIAPVFVMNFPLKIVAPPWAAPLLRVVEHILPSLAYQRTLFVGSPCSEEGTVGLVAGESLDRVVSPLQVALEGLAREKHASLIVWKDFPENTWGVLDSMAADREVFTVVSYPTTRLDLNCEGFDGYLAGIGSRHRWKLKNKLKRSHERGPLDVAVLQRPDEATLGEIFALFWGTYMKGEVKLERLGEAFFREIAESGQAHFITLRDPARGNLAGFALCFPIGSRAVIKFIGIDYHYGEDWFLYFRLWEAQVEWAIRMGATEIQNGQTCYAPKFDLGLNLVPLTNYCKHRNRVINAILRWVARGITWSTLDEDLNAHIQAHPQARHIQFAGASAQPPVSEEETKG